MDDIDDIKDAICLECLNYLDCKKARKNYVISSDCCNSFQELYGSSYEIEL